MQKKKKKIWWLHFSLQNFENIRDDILDQIEILYDPYQNSHHACNELDFLGLIQNSCNFPHH